MTFFFEKVMGALPLTAQTRPRKVAARGGEAMPGKRLLLTAVLGLTLTATGCCRMWENWCAPRPCCSQPVACQPQCCPTGAYYAAPSCPPGCAPVAGPVQPVPVAAPVSASGWNTPPNGCPPCR